MRHCIALNGSFSNTLVLSVKECAARVLELLGHPEDCAACGVAGRGHIRPALSVAALLRDELRLIMELLHLCTFATMAR
jgi:hypothetical protein